MLPPIIVDIVIGARLHLLVLFDLMEFIDKGYILYEPPLFSLQNILRPLFECDRLQTWFTDTISNITEVIDTIIIKELWELFC